MVGCFIVCLVVFVVDVVVDDDVVVCLFVVLFVFRLFVSFANIQPWEEKFKAPSRLIVHNRFLYRQHS